MRAAAAQALSIAGTLAMVSVGCTGSCGRTHFAKDASPGPTGAGPTTTRLDYAPFMKASGAAIVADFAGHLGVAPSTLIEQGSGSPRDGGNDREVYAVANGGKIELRFDRSRKPLLVQYHGPAGCLSASGSGAKPVAPAEANASVLSLLRRMALAVDDTVRVESQLHDDGLIWIGVYVWQTYRGELIEHPSVFVIVDGITNRVCNMRVPRWYAGLDALGPPLAQDALLACARAAGARLSAGPPLGPATLRSLRLDSDTLCRDVRFAGPSGLTLCVDIVTGNAAADPW